MIPRSMTRSLAAALLTGLLVTLGLAAGGPAAANPLLPDCKEAPAAEVPGRGVVGFFDSPPTQLPPDADPFADGAGTSVYAQYGYAGLRWNTYDLGCGPDVARSPDAVVGTAVGNWLLNLPKAAVAATGGILDAAFAPTFLGTFDPLVANVVDALRRGVFEQWVPLVLAATGGLLVLRARRASLASSAAAIGWALLVLVAVTAVFRWPLAAGQAADQTVTATLGAVTAGLTDTPTDGDGDGMSPAEQSTASLHQAVLWHAWLGGTFGSPDSDVARQYGPVIFDAQALTWREAEILRSDPAAGRRILEAKSAQFAEAAEQVKAQDPDAYEYLTGKRSDARVGYALLSGLAALCAVPFLVMAALLVLGALIIVRFGVMLFPAFATLGLFPAMRPLVTGIANTVAAAVINATIFGIGAAVMVRGLDVLLDPASELPAWLIVVLSLLLTLVMWVVLRPFRRLTQMVSPRHNLFADGAGAVTRTGRGVAGAGKRLITLAVGSFLGTTAATKATEPDDEARDDEPVSPSRERVEGASLPTPVAALPGEPAPATRDTLSRTGTGTAPRPASTPAPAPSPPSASTGVVLVDPPEEQRYESRDAGVWRPVDRDFDSVPEPVEPEDVDGDNVYVIYRPGKGESLDSGARDHG